MHSHVPLTGFDNYTSFSDDFFSDGPDVGYCTHMAWLPQGPSIPSLLLLVLSFENGFAVFHVDLPVKLDNSKIGFHHIQEPTQSTVVSATPMLSPIAATRWKGENECSFTSWLQCGPHVDPCIAVLLHDAVSPVARVMLFAIHFPTYRKGPLPKSLMSCRILASTTIPKDSALFPSGLLQSSRSLICYSNKKLVDMSLCLMSSSTPASPVTFLSHPVVSNPPGLTSSGDPFLVDAENDDDGILYVFSMVLCERGKSDMDASMLKWSPPMRRIWLCRVVVGDTKETCVEEGKEDRGFGDNEEVTGGAASGVVCEFNHESLSGLTPARIVRCSGRNVCAVLFRPSLGLGADTAKALSLTADYIALVDYGVGKPVIQVTRGRDISFFPSSGSEFTSGLILSVDGSSLTYFHWNSLKECELATSFRPIVGVDSGKDYVDCRRISIFADSLKLNLTAWGTRLRDNRVCFVAGDLCGIAEATVTEWSNLLPNLVSGRSAWIGVGEDVLTTVGLHGDGSGYRNFALATTSTRVLIVSSALTVVAESKKPLSGSSLAPLGSFAVCFSSDSKVRYLCCLDAGLSEGVVATLAESRYGRIHSSLLAVRPDRLILCPCQSGLSLLELGQTPDSFRLPSGITRPALLLEPMVANAVCVGGKQNQSTLILRSVVEKFGRKISSMTHGENEGLGSYGAGLTNGTFAVLNKYKLNHAASWLLTGTVNFDRTANSRVLPPWLPIGPKSQGILNSDAMLHVIANGDSYLSEYVKSPDQNAASTLPRQSDTVAYLCREYAQDMLCHQGKPIDALKTLDISGAESTESIMLQLTLMLEKSKSNKVAGVLKSLGGCGDNGRARVPSGAAKSSSSLAALALSFKMNSGSRCKQGMNADQVNCWMKPLAPSLQRSKFTNRARQRIIGEKDLENLERREVDDLSSLWTTPCNESKHVW